MSRISSFNLYKCPDCGQINKRAEHGTYRVGSPPNDWGTSSHTVKTCSGCKSMRPIFEYLHVARTSGSSDDCEIIWLVEEAAPLKKKMTFIDRLLSPFKRKEGELTKYPFFKL